MSARRAVRSFIAVGLLALPVGISAAQEGGADLAAPEPTRIESVLESGSGLGRPSPSGGGAEPASVGLGPFQSGAHATAAQPARIAVSILGPLAPSLRSLLATDLAYVREVRLDDRGDLVVAGTGFASDGTARVELVLGDRSGDRGALRRRYEGDEQGLAPFVHGFVDDVVEALTARRSAFVSRLVFARRVGPGRKDVYSVDADGNNLTLVSTGRGVATLPGIAPDGVYYTVVTPTSVFITRTGTNDQPVVGGPGVHMGATVCDGRLFFSSARDGNTDIYSARPDGSDERRLTDHAAIEVSPTCGPDDRLAFVSDRTGTPQIWVMQRDGTRERQVTREESATQTPAWCGEQIAFTAVGNGPMRVMVMDLRTAAVRRVSPPGGAYKDPAFSPDCRMLAFTSERGVEIATPEGRLRRLVAPGHAETVRWAPVSGER